MCAVAPVSRSAGPQAEHSLRSTGSATQATLARRTLHSQKYTTGSCCCSFTCTFKLFDNLFDFVKLTLRTL